MTKEENLETSLSLNRTIPRWSERARVLLCKKDVPWTNNGGKRIVGKWNIREEKVMKQMERRWIIGWQFYYFSNAAINHRVTMSIARVCLLRFIGFPRRCQARSRGRERMSFELVSKPFLCDVRERENEPSQWKFKFQLSRHEVAGKCRISACTRIRARVFDVNRGNKAERTWTKKRDTTYFPDDALSSHPLYHRLSSCLSDVVSFAVTTKLYWHALSRAFPSIHAQ